LPRVHVYAIIHVYVNIDDGVKSFAGTTEGVTAPMFPNQVSTLARHYTQMMTEQPRHAVPRRRPEPGAIRKHTGWTLVQIGLRIAASASR